VKGREGAPAMIKAAIYARPSAPGESCDAQLSKLRMVAEQRELSVVAHYFDMTVGLDKKRPGLAELLRDAQKGRFNALLVDGLDRIAWSVPHLRGLIEELRKSGIRIISIRDHFDSGATLSSQTVLTDSALFKVERRLAREGLDISDIEPL